MRFDKFTFKAQEAIQQAQRWRKSLLVILALALLACAPPAHRGGAEALQHDLPTTWEAFDLAASALAERVSFLAAEITQGTCETVQGLAPLTSLAVGSSFKLYILGELAEQIAGRSPSTLSPARWDGPLAIQAQFKSIPGGPLLFVADGTLFTVRYFAEQVIQRSDNTATDHLLFLLGRQTVEQRMAKMGHHDPSLNRPLLATRELAILKFLYTDQELAVYLAASDAEKRQILANEKRGFAELEAYFEQHGVPTTPTRINTIEYFADRFDMCSTLMALHQMAKDWRLQPVAEALTLADPLGIDREDWIYVGFKGGSELGVLAGNWLLQRKDGRLFVMSVAFNDRFKALDMDRLIEVLQAAVKILFTTP